MKYILTITERTFMPPEAKETNTYHIICDSLTAAAERIGDFEANYGILISATIAPWEE